MNRREFSGFVAGAAVSALLPSSLFAELTTGVSPMAAELYARALVLDCNSGPPYEFGGGYIVPAWGDRLLPPVSGWNCLGNHWVE